MLDDPRAADPGGGELDLLLVASFLTLTRERHYGRAAAVLHVTPPALSKRIHRLERQLGVTLIDRGSGVALAVTAAGQRFADAAGPLLAQAHEARRVARTQPPSHFLRVGFLAGPARALFETIDMERIALTVRHSCPEVRLICISVPAAALSHCLSERQVDVLLTIAPMENADVQSYPLTMHPVKPAGSAPLAFHLAHRSADRRVAISVLLDAFRAHDPGLGAR
jgi:DNA-binding transcriptional LysR family regulator